MPRQRWIENWPIERVAAEISAKVESERISLRNAMEWYMARHRFLEPIKGFIRAFCLGLFRKTLQLDWLAETLLGVSPLSLPTYERNLLRVILYEARYRNVDYDRLLRFAREIHKLNLSRKDLNIIKKANLRSLTRGMKREKRLAVTYSVPEWIVKYLLSILDKKEALEFLRRINEPSVIWIRVNTLKIDRDSLLSKLYRRGIKAYADADLPDIIRVPRLSQNLSRLEEHREGLFYIQDKASAAVCHAIGEIKGIVYDACSAPGGKATHAFQLSRHQADILAAELKKKRLHSMIKTVRRLGFDINVVNTDSTRPPIRRADIIILDPDCTGLGRLGHSPEIRLWIKPSHVSYYAKLQRKLLASLAPLLTRKGKLVYSTCTITLEENEANTRWAMEKYGLELCKPKVDVGIEGLEGLNEARRFYPHLHDTQGFYFAVMRAS
ncbi:MAG TPA: hypothetical protein ENJ59_01130 [Thermofilum sp.]|nr:hypothetical protein [Thermofilum sp.]